MAFLCNCFVHLNETHFGIFLKKHKYISHEMRFGSFLSNSLFPSHLAEDRVKAVVCSFFFHYFFLLTNIYPQISYIVLWMSQAFYEYLKITSRCRGHRQKVRVAFVQWMWLAETCVMTSRTNAQSQWRMCFVAFVFHRSLLSITADIDENSWIYGPAVAMGKIRMLSFIVDRIRIDLRLWFLQKELVLLHSRFFVLDSVVALGSPLE